MADAGYQQFYEHCRNTFASSKFLDIFPYELSFGVDQDETFPLPFCSYGALGNQILVTKSYDDMFHRMLRLRSYDRGTARGVVLTGQSGTGASQRLDPHPVRQLTSISVFQEKLPEVRARAADFSSPGRIPV